MAISFKSPVITHQSFDKTIQTDQQVFRWFLFLVLHTKVKDDLVKKDEEARAIYKRLMMYLSVYRVLLIILLAAMITTIWTQQFLYIFFAAPIWLVWMLINKQLKQQVTAISNKIVAVYFNEQDFKVHTLFQICEVLAEKYKVHSLVEGVTTTDILTRKALIFILFAVVFIQLMTFWKGLATIFLLYFTIVMILNTSVVYTRFMK